MMNNYLQNQVFRTPQLENLPSEDLGLVVVIPSYNEPQLIRSLDALNRCRSPKFDVEIIIVLNQSENEGLEAIEQNQKTKTEFEIWNKDRNFPFYLLEAFGLPTKHAGVGLARKIGMDEAAHRFELINNQDGVIVCFDADAVCEENYLMELERHFNLHSKTTACSIHFEHPLEGEEFDTTIYQGILQYELHLRYYKQALEFLGVPYAYHTIGSSMAVRSWVYQKLGGMNKRKAGEDFYFLQKVFTLGNFSELKTTKVIPSPRMSDRVPFGTGKAIGDWINDKKQEYFTYNFSSFIELKYLLDRHRQLYTQDFEVLNFSEVVDAFWKQIEGDQMLVKIRERSTTEELFSKHFYHWFNPFMVLKFIHFSRDEKYPNTPLKEAVRQLLYYNRDDFSSDSYLDLLQYFRSRDLK